MSLVGERVEIDVFEDGHIHRDFVFVDDVVEAFVRACETEAASGQTLNIGTGEPRSIRDPARRCARRVRATVDLPLAVAPTRATDWPAGTCRSNWVSTGWSVPR